MGSSSFIKEKLSIIIFVFCTINVYSSSFITTWTTSNDSITISTKGISFYNYAVSWVNLSNPGLQEGSLTSQIGDAIIDSLANGDIYQLAITGTFPSANFSNYENRKKILSVEQWGNGKWKTFSGSFASCENLQINAVDTPDLSQVSDMSSMFSGCTSMKGNSSMNNWNTSTITNMDDVFREAASFNVNIGNWNTVNVLNMSSMFMRASSFNQDIGNWNVGKVTNMTDMFKYASVFDQNIGKWNTENVTNMNGMFYHATSFNQNIGNWNTGKLTRTSQMFSGASSFNQSVGGWDVSKVFSMSDMFHDANSFNQDIGSWNTENVTSMAYMFEDATVFNQDIGSWNTENVTEMGFMFKNAKAFNKDISNWNLTKVGGTTAMFSSANSFNQDISKWKTDSMVYMNYMFYNASSFNQDLGSWVLASATNVDNMLSNSGMSCTNYSSTLVKWSDNPKTASNVTFSGQAGMSYGTNAIDARNSLTNVKNWTISGDVASGQNCSLITSSQKINLSYKELRIYPNPCSNVLNISNYESIANYTIFDLFGRIVKSGTKSSTIDVGGIADGVYQVRFVDNTGLVVQLKRLVVKHG